MLAKIVETIIVHNLLRALVGFVSPTILNLNVKNAWTQIGENKPLHSGIHTCDRVNFKIE